MNLRNIHVEPNHDRWCGCLQDQLCKQILVYAYEWMHTMMVCIHNHGLCIHNNGIRCASITSVHSVSCASVIVHLDYSCTPTLVSATCASKTMAIDAHPSKSTCTLTVCIHAWMHTIRVHPYRFFQMHTNRMTSRQSDVLAGATNDSPRWRLT